MTFSTLPPLESPTSSWMTRSQRSRRRDKGLLQMLAHQYYYRRRVRKHLSENVDQFLPGRSQFDSDHRVNFSTPTSCQSATFVRPMFAFVLCVLRQKNHKQRHRCDESVSINCAAGTMIPKLYCRLLARWRHGFLL